MTRIDTFLARRRRWVLAVTALVLVAAVPFAARQTEHLTSGGYDVPGSGSERVQRALAEFDDVQREHLGVVLRAEPGASAEALPAAFARLERAVAHIDHVALGPQARAAIAEQPGARIVVVPLAVDVTGSAAIDLAVELRDGVGAGDQVREGVRTYVVGQAALWAGLQDLSREDLTAAETRGFPLVLLILLAVFGSLAAALLPLAVGVLSVLLSGAIVFFLSQAMDMSVFVTNVASMIGIGVAVDYSLFMLARYREEVRAGRPPEVARVVALHTSGVAVLFSALTVIVSLASLFLIDSTALRSMAVGAIVVVALAAATAVLLLPVLIAVLGRRAYEPGRVLSVLGRLVRGRATARRDRRFWERVTGAVMRRPVTSLAVAGAVMLTLAAPALSLRWGDAALRQFPPDDPTRVGAELAAAQAGPGSLGPLQILVRLRSGDLADSPNRAAVERYAAALERDPEVADVRPPVPAPDRRSVLLEAVPRSHPESPSTYALLDRVRAQRQLSPALAAVDVGGASAFNMDFQQLVSGSMTKVVVFVALLSLLVLLVLLRSVVLPLKAVAMTLLSVAAAYGVLVVVFQWGWLDGLFGFQSLGYINPVTPPLLLAVMFGLSMDYEVFLLSRIRERYEITHDTRRAVAEGLRASAATITSAALIMVAVFAVFAATGVPSIKEIGLGLAVAVALDATLVRLVLVPAMMELMGRWNWWLPRPLARRWLAEPAQTTSG